MSKYSSNKRQHPDGASVRRRHDKKKFRKITNPSVRKSDLTGGLSGILFSCTPHHENTAFNEAVLLLNKHYEELFENNTAHLSHGNENDNCNGPVQEKGDDINEQGDNKTVTESLDDELKILRNEENRPFTRVETGVTGIVFVRVNAPSVDREKLVERALREARATASPNSRHCIRIIPVHMTCYAKPEDAAKAAAAVAREYFPKLPDIKSGYSSEPGDDKSTGNAKDVEDLKLTYAIAFRSRLNSGVHRDDYIHVIAEAIQKLDTRYQVNLTTPDVTLIVEILKTSCCIGTFRNYFQLSKMNLREAACPTIPKKPLPAAKTEAGCTEATTNKRIESSTANDTNQEDRGGVPITTGKNDGSMATNFEPKAESDDAHMLKEKTFVKKVTEKDTPSSKIECNTDPLATSVNKSSIEKIEASADIEKREQ